MHLNRSLLALVLVGTFGCGAHTAASSDAGSGDVDSSAADGEAAPDGTSDSSSEDAAEADAGSSDADAGQPGCVQGTLDLVLRAAPGAPAYCLSPGTGCAGALDWLTIRSSDGSSTFPQVEVCGTDCTTCMNRVCPPLACVAPTLLGDAGAQGGWDGKYFKSGECGSTNASCTSSACAPAGHYIAHMCGWAALPDASFVGGSCHGASTTATCVDVPFDWPQASTSVTGEIGAGPADASAD